MERRRIGSLEVSVVGVGANNFGTEFFGPGCDQEQTTAIVDAALESGINFFDTAEEYSIDLPHFGTRGRSEEFLGRALGSRREQVVIASKFLVTSPNDPEQTGAERIERALEDSLRRLGTDYIDLYQQHTPDPRTPPEETLAALDRLVKAGKVREIGVCNYSGARIDEVVEIAGERGLTPYRSVQNRYNVVNAAYLGSGPDSTGAEGSVEELLARDPGGFVEACEEHELKLIPYFPLANGLLTGKYRRAAPPPPGSRLGNDTQVARLLAESELSERNFDIVEALEGYAGERGHSLLELAMSWLVSQPVVGTVITGVTRPEQIRSNAESVHWQLSDDDFAAIDAILGRSPAAQT